MALAGAAHASTLVNGSFEQPGGPPIRRALTDNDGFIPGWTHLSGGDYYESSGQDDIAASHGDYYVSFGHNGHTGGGLSTTFFGVAGTLYTLNYDIRLQQAPSNEASSFLILISDVSLGLVGGGDSGNAVNTGWTAGAAFSFVGTGHDINLTFLDATPSGGGSNLALDNVRVTPNTGSPDGVPEPASWALMIIGFAGTGGLLRRRRSLAVVA